MSEANDRVELALKCRNEVDATISKISGVENNIFARADVGNDLGTLKNLTSLDSSELRSIKL